MIAFDQVGNGPPVVFLHSGLANRTMWQPQIVAFSARYTCYLMDLPGYGASTTPDGPFSYPREIARFIETTIGEPAALVGSSYGASQALRTALQAPNWTGPLVLANSTIMRPETASPELEAVWTEADAAWERGEHERANEIEIEGWVDGRGRPAGQAAAPVRESFLEMNRQIWRRHHVEPVPEQLDGPAIEPERIAQPVLLIDGPFDFVDVRESNQALLRRLPNAEYSSIPGTAHFPSYERPGIFNEITLDFLDRTWGSVS